MEKLLDDWASIKNNSEYKQAVEQSKERMELQAKQKAVLQNLRMQINRLRQKGEDTEDLLLELRDKEKSYERGKKRPLGPTTPPRSAHNPVARAASARRALRSRLETDDIPPRPDRLPPVCPQLVPRDNAGARCGLDSVRRHGERTIFEGRAERNH